MHDAVFDPGPGPETIFDDKEAVETTVVAVDSAAAPLAAPLPEPPGDPSVHVEPDLAKCIRLADLLAGQHRPFDTSMDAVLLLYSRLGGPPSGEGITALKTRVSEIFDSVRFSAGDIVMITGVPLDTYANGVVGRILSFHNLPVGGRWIVKIITQNKPLSVQLHNLRSISSLEFGAQAAAHDANPLRFRTNLREASK
jgi:antitoxin (DNA-binding transcriptional repressor) of toxin-antitoxin stability system